MLAQSVMLAPGKVHIKYSPVNPAFKIERQIHSKSRPEIFCFNGQLKKLTQAELDENPTRKQVWIENKSAASPLFAQNARMSRFCARGDPSPTVLIYDSLLLHVATRTSTMLKIQTCPPKKQTTVTEGGPWPCAIQGGEEMPVARRLRHGLRQGARRLSRASRRGCRQCWPALRAALAA